MGEARRRLLRQDQIRQTQPCVYCGAPPPSATIEHMPPVAMFVRRDRPRDFEFSSCKGCNNGSRDIDHIASFLTRIGTELPTPEDMKEFRLVFGGIINNFPALATELLPSEDLIADHYSDVAHRYDAPHTFFDVSGPLASDALRYFAAKLVFALHCRKVGDPVPERGGVFAVVWTNYCAYSNKIPERVFSLFEKYEPMRQGNKHTWGQFEFGSEISDEGSVTVHQAYFRRSFMVMGFASKTLEFFERSKVDVFRPGFLRRDFPFRQLPSSA